MKYRPFGKTGLQVSEIVIGGGAVGGILIYADEDTRRAAIHRALAGGINWIDTAPLYGDGKSESAIGRLLEEVPAHRQPHISTKVRIDPLSKDMRGQVERSVHQSLDRLRRDRVEVLILHNSVSSEHNEDGNLLTPDQVLDPGGAADALQNMVDQGFASFTGLTATGDTSAVQRVVESGRFSVAQVYYNLLNPSAGRSVPPGWIAQDYGNLIGRCVASGLAVMNIRVLAAGVIATDIRHGREASVAGGLITSEQAIAADEERAKMVVQALRDRYGTRAQTAIRYALANPDISCIVVGMAELDHLEEALAAAELGPLPQEGLAAIDRLIDTDFGRLNSP